MINLCNKTAESKGMCGYWLYSPQPESTAAQTYIHAGLCSIMARILSDADLIMAIIITTATPGNKTRAHQIVLKSILNKVLDNPCNDMYAYLFGNVNIFKGEPRKDAAV
jgi:hypothetical protein